MNKSDARNLKRRSVVEAIILRKQAVGLVARIHKITQRTAFNWLARYRNGGWQALNEGSRQGRPSKVTGADLKWLYDAITLGSPLNYKLDFCLWTLNNMRAVLAQERDIEISKSSVCRLLHHIGLTPQRPLHKSYKQDKRAMTTYLEQTYPDTVIEAKKYNARIYFVDAAAFRSDAHRGTIWGRRGKTPVVKDSGGRFGFKLVSAVSPRGDMHFEVIEDRMNSEQFIEFLKKLRHDAGCPVFVVADNARYHHSKMVQAFLKEQRGNIMMAFLPAYSPELNPDEQVWNYAKREIGKMTIRSKEEMAKAILSVMTIIQKKADLIRSFLCMPGTQYAAL